MSVGGGGGSGRAHAGRCEGACGVASCECECGSVCTRDKTDTRAHKPLVRRGCSSIAKIPKGEAHNRKSSSVPEVLSHVCAPKKEVNFRKFLKVSLTLGVLKISFVFARFFSRSAKSRRWDLPYYSSDRLGASKRAYRSGDNEHVYIMSCQ